MPAPLGQRPAQRSLLLDALTLRISEELGALAGLSSNVQEALSLCDFAEHTDPVAIRGLQGIDRITQALEDLCRVVAVISQALPKEQVITAQPVLAAVRLHELALTLDPGAPRRGTVKRSLDGDIYWF